MTTTPPGILSSFFTPSSSVLSSISSITVQSQPGPFPSACLWNPKDEPWYGPCLPKRNAFPFFISFQSLSPLRFVKPISDIRFPGKHSYSMWVMPGLFAGFKVANKIGFILFLSRLAAFPLLSVKFQPELLSAFAIRIGTKHLVNPTPCPR